MNLHWLMGQAKLIGQLLCLGPAAVETQYHHRGQLNLSVISPGKLLIFRFSDSET